MKTFIVMIIGLASITAHADLSTQMTNITQDWDLPSLNLVLRVAPQDTNSVTAYQCNRNTYYNSPNKYCSYSQVNVFTYSSDLDAFYALKTGNDCSSSIQVSSGGHTLIGIQDPYRADGNCGASGSTDAFTKIN